LKPFSIDKMRAIGYYRYMPRPRLTDAEREAKRRARSAFTFSDAAYKHYSPEIEGYGSEDEWISAAEALAGGRGAFRPQPNRPRINPDLVTLMLEEMPSHIDGLKKAFRNALFLFHPDRPNGSNEACRNVLTAFERLSKFY
jgi:hypothetical protein